MSTRFFGPMLSFIVLSFALFVTGCAKEDEESTPQTTAVYLNIVTPDSTYRVDIQPLPHQTISGSEVVLFSSIIGTALLPINKSPSHVLAGNDNHTLYVYRLVGADGFSPYQRGRPDLRWGQFSLGYVDLATKKNYFPSSLGLPSTYNVNNLDTVHCYRKLEIVSPVGASFVNFTDLTLSQVDTTGGMTPGYALSAFVPDTIVALGAGNYSYQLYSFPDSTGFSRTITWNELQTGYYLTTSKRTWFRPDSLIGAAFRLPSIQTMVIQ